VSLPLRWTEHATSQLAAIAEYISLGSPIYAEQTVDRIIARLRQVQAFPQSGRAVPEMELHTLREVIALPYRIVYRTTESAIEVIAVIHARQDLSSHLSG
jgi:toxin ParE1/3/4